MKCLFSTVQAVSLAPNQVLEMAGNHRYPSWTWEARTGGSRSPTTPLLKGKRAFEAAFREAESESETLGRGWVKHTHRCSQSEDSRATRVVFMGMNEN